MTDAQLYRIILGLVKFPYAQICRHSVALDLLSVMEESGTVLPDGLVAAICKSSAGDAEAEQILTRV